MENMEDMGGITESRQTSTQVVNIVTLVFTVFIVTLRCISRKRLHVDFAADDWLMIVAVLMNIAHTLGTAMAVHYGEGLHAWDIEESNFLSLLKWAILVEAMYQVVMYFTKVSMLVFYIRFLPFWSQGPRITKGLIWLITAFVISTVLVTIFQCSPVAGVWDHSIESQCINSLVFFSVNAVMNMATDIAICVLPIPFIYKIDRPRSTRIQIMLLFGLSFLTCGLAATRFYTVPFFTESHDPTWDVFAIAICTHVECALAVFCGCAPAIKPLFSRARPQEQESEPKNSRATSASNPSQIETKNEADMGTYEDVSLE